MKVKVLVTLDMTLLDDAGNDLPDPTPGTIEYAQAVESAHEAINNAVYHFQGVGFVHELENNSSIIVTSVDIADN